MTWQILITFVEVKENYNQQRVAVSVHVCVRMVSTH